MIENLSESVRGGLDAFTDLAKSLLGDDLRAIVLYGSAAEGRMRATSDVNLIVVLRRFDRGAVDGLRDSYRTLQAAIDLKAMFLLESEIEEAAEEFAQKFSDILHRRRILAGDDPFTGLQIERAALVRRVRQALLNLTLRLRESYVERSLREEQAALAVAEAAAPLRTAAAAILEVERGERLHPREALEELVRTLAWPEFEKLLPAMSAARETRAFPGGEAASHLFATVQLAEEMHRRTLRL